MVRKVNTIRNWFLGFIVAFSFGLAPQISKASDNLEVQNWLERPGVRLLVVEFYATWCKPCMAAVPRWQALYEKYRDEGLRMLVVNTLDPDMGCTSPGWTPDGVLCDPDGVIQKGMGVGGNLPAAFLWSWQGDLLVRAGHVDEVEKAVDAYFRKNPRVLVEATNEKNRAMPELRDLVRSELRRAGKFTLVASEEERKELAKLRKASFNPAYADSSQCELGAELAANTLLRAKVYRNRLSLSLFSAETSCLIAQAATRYNPKRPDEATAEAVDKLLGQVRREIQTPGTLAMKPSKAVRPVTIMTPVVETQSPKESPKEERAELEKTRPSEGEQEALSGGDAQENRGALEAGKESAKEEPFVMKPPESYLLGLKLGLMMDGATISWPILDQSSWSNSSGRMAILHADKFLNERFSVGLVLATGSFEMKPKGLSSGGDSRRNDFGSDFSGRGFDDGFGDDFDSETGTLRVRQGALSSDAFEIGLLAVGASLKAHFPLSRIMLRPGAWIGYNVMTRKALTDPDLGVLLESASTEGIVYGAGLEAAYPLTSKNLSLVADIGILAQPSGRSGDENVTFEPMVQVLFGLQYGK